MGKRLPQMKNINIDAENGKIYAEESVLSNACEHKRGQNSKDETIVTTKTRLLIQNIVILKEA